MKIYPLLNYKNYELEKHTLPILVKFKNENLHLWYFASCHIYDYKNQMFKDIETAFNDLEPDLVILEGSVKINPNHPKSKTYYSKILAKTKNEVITEKGEFGLGLLLALEKGLEVFCPEPEFQDEISNLITKFDRKFIFTSFILQMAVQWSVMSQKENDLQSYLLEEIEFQKSELGELIEWKGFDFSWETFLNSFKLATNQVFLNSNTDLWIELDDPIPWSTKKYDWNILNDISQENCNFRDQYILNKLENKFTQFKKILVIYGGSHFYAQEPALNQLFTKI